MAKYTVIASRRTTTIEWTEIEVEEAPNAEIALEEAEQLLWEEGEDTYEWREEGGCDLEGVTFSIKLTQEAA